MASLFSDDEDNLDAIAAEIDSSDDNAGVTAADISPRSNPDLAGHETVERALLEDFNAGRLPHAIILAGAAGIGKATLAYRLARFLFAEGAQDAGLFGDAAKPDTLYVSPDHPVFRRVASGGHADLLTIEREFDEKKGRLKSEISVEAVRKVHPFLRKTAAEGGWRVVIVDGAEYMNHNGQNALLKILEEPPAKTVLVLTTSQPGSFLPTIRSRCRIVAMEPLAEGVLSTLMDKFAPGLSLQEKTALCRLAEGSLGRALRFHRDDGIALYKNLLGVMAGLPDLDIPAVYDLADKITRTGAEHSYETAAEIMSGWCERMARHRARGLALPDLTPGDGAVFSRLQQVYPERHFLESWEKIAHLFRCAENYTLDKRLTLVTAFLTLQKPDHPGLSL